LQLSGQSVSYSPNNRNIPYIGFGVSFDTRCKYIDTSVSARAYALLAATPITLSRTAALPVSTETTPGSGIRDCTDVNGVIPAPTFVAGSNLMVGFCRL